MNHAGTLPTDQQRLALLAGAMVTPLPGRCVQCGICTYNCPSGIDVRARARQGEPVADPGCLRCGTCVARCPRSALQLVRRAVAA